MAAWVTCTLTAPAVKVPDSAIATKALSCRISTVVSVSRWVIGIIKSFSFHYKSTDPRMINNEIKPDGPD